MAQHYDLTGGLPAAGVGLDIGSTLVTVARVHNGELHLAHYPADDREHVVALLGDAGQGPAVACAGAGAAGWQEALKAWEPTLVSEFDATAAGARALLARAGMAAADAFLVASVGTGTSVLQVAEQSVQRVGGSAMGGGTLLGLGHLLCGTGDYAELARLAAQGNRRQVDLLVGDVYPDGVDEVFRELTAANFGRVRSREPSDLARGLCGLLGENLGLICGGLARLHEMPEVWYCGATLLDNPVLTAVLLATTAYAGAPAQVLADGAYCGAVGALAHLACPPEEHA